MSNSKLRLRVELDRTTAQYIGLSYLVDVSKDNGSGCNNSAISLY